MTAYVTQSQDTTKEAEIYQFALLRQAGASKRLAMGAKLSRSTRQLCLFGVLRREPSKAAAKTKFLCAVLGFTPTFEIQDDERMWIQDSVDLAREMHALLESAAIPYYVTGGVASSAHGEPRSTRDLDLVIQASVENLDRLVTALDDNDFYVPETALENVKAGTEKTLNVTHKISATNVDIIISANAPFDQSQMARRELVDGFYIHSAEDAVLQKLRWSQQSLSEKQLRDVLGILKMQLDGLDKEYLRRWAQVLGVSERLEDAFAMAEIQ